MQGAAFFVHGAASPPPAVAPPTRVVPNESAISALPSSATQSAARPLGRGRALLTHGREGPSNAPRARARHWPWRALQLRTLRNHCPLVMTMLALVAG